MRMFQGEVAEMWLAAVLGGSAWIRCVWVGGCLQGLTDHRLCRHATVAALMPCLHPSLLTTVGLLPLLFLVFCRNGLQSVPSIKNLSLLTLFSKESCFLLRDLSSIVSRGCCSKPLTIHFKHGETATYYGYYDT